MQHITCVWERVGSLPPGVITDIAVSPDFVHDKTLFAATMAGLYRSRDAARSWQRVGTGFEGRALTAIALSPAFADDGLVLAASLDGSIFRVRHGSGSWAQGAFEDRRAQGVSVVMSPDFLRDGTAFLATLSDGIFRSHDRGARWDACTFGLLDLNILALAISPSFAEDGTIFAATGTGVFRSHNGGLAWREVEWSIDQATVQCLAVSPDFSSDGTLFAGTDASGLFRSCDGGAIWTAVGETIDGTSITAIAMSPHFSVDRTVFVIAESGLYVSRDAGTTWPLCAELSDALCLTVTPAFPDEGSVIVGCIQGGAYRSNADLTHWLPSSGGIVGRYLTGLVVSPAVAADRDLLAFGPGEGIIRSSDGGGTWTEDNDGLPSLHVTDLASGMAPNGQYNRYTALPQGVWMSRGWGMEWEQVSDFPVRLLALSPSMDTGMTIVAATESQGLWASWNAGRQWHPVAIPWQAREILALALSPLFERDRCVFVVVRGADGVATEAWQGRLGLGGSWERLVHHRDAAHGIALAVPQALPWDGSWYTMIGSQLYKLRAQVNSVATRAFGDYRNDIGAALPSSCGTVVDLTVLPTLQSSIVLAATELGLYLLAEGTQEWCSLKESLTTHPIVAVAPSPTYAHDHSIFAMEWGGIVWRVRLSGVGS